MSTWVGIGRSEVGHVRTMNQDTFVVLDHHGLWAVADGMGGHVGGEIAAHIATTTVQAHAGSSADTFHGGIQLPTEFLTDMIRRAHDAILRRAKSESKLNGMGTTIVLLAIVPSPTPTAYIGHVGDSRAYRFRSGALTALTRDHTLIEQYLSRGILTEATAKTHPERHVLTRALGMQSPIKPTVSSFPLEEGDRILLCSDGLTKMLDDDQIESIFCETGGTPAHTCDRLIDAALTRGGEDNVTVVVVAPS